MSLGPTVTVTPTYATVEIDANGATVTVDVPETTVDITGVGPQGPAGTGADGYLLQAYDSTDQVAASTTVAYPIRLGTVDISDGITVANNGSSQPTRITFANDGNYDVQFSIQFVNTSASEANANVWFRKNDVDLADSNSQITVPKKHGSADGAIIMALNLIVNAAGGDYVEIMWQTESTDVSIQHLPAGTTPTTPATPSVIVTATAVRYLEGIASGGTTGQVLTKASATNYDTVWATPAAPGLLYVGRTNLSAVGTGGQNIPSIFNSTYDNYRILISDIVGSTNGYVYWQLSANGTPNSTANSYTRNSTLSTISGVNHSWESANLFFFGFIDTTISASAAFEMYNPFQASPTTWTADTVRSNADMWSFAGRHNQSTSYDGLFLAPSAGTLTCTVQVFGYRQ